MGRRIRTPVLVRRVLSATVVLVTGAAAGAGRSPVPRTAAVEGADEPESPAGEATGPPRTAFLSARGAGGIAAADTGTQATAHAAAVPLAARGLTVHGWLSDQEQDATDHHASEAFQPVSAAAGAAEKRVTAADVRHAPSSDSALTLYDVVRCPPQTGPDRSLTACPPRPGPPNAPGQCWATGDDAPCVAAREQCHRGAPAAPRGSSVWLSGLLGRSARSLDGWSSANDWPWVRQVMARAMALASATGSVGLLRLACHDCSPGTIDEVCTRMGWQDTVAGVGGLARQAVSLAGWRWPLAKGGAGASARRSSSPVEATSPQPERDCVATVRRRSAGGLYRVFTMR